MKIYLGSAGIPTVAKDRSTLGGIKCIAELGLNALEVQFVRRVGMSSSVAKQVGKVAKELGVKLSVHAPYAINLCAREALKVEASKRRILEAAKRAAAMEAEVVVFHPGYYGSLSVQQAFQLVCKACSELCKSTNKLGVKLGLETMGKVSQFGELEEILKICQVVEGCVPVVDWAHLNCRSAGSLRTQADYAKVFDTLKPLKLKHLHTHYTCAEYSLAKMGKGNERYHLELKANKPPFKPLAQEILKRKFNITLISESPVLEQDSLVMKHVFTELGYKFVGQFLLYD